MTLEQELKEIAEEKVRKEMAKIPPVEFPNVQKVEEINPIVIPPPQKIDISGLEKLLQGILNKKEIPVELGKVERLLEDVADKIQKVAEKREVNNEDVLNQILEKLGEEKIDVTEPVLKELVAEIKKMNAPGTYKGGGIGPGSVYQKNAAGTIINPATSDKQDALIGTFSSYSTETTVQVQITSTSVVAANADRKHLIIINISDTPIYLSTGTAALNSGIPLYAKGDFYEWNNNNRYTGAVTAITTIADKKLSVLES